MTNNIKKNNVQLCWAFILILMGVILFFRLPYVLSRIEKINQFTLSTNSIKFCFYFVGIMLIGGGLKKIFK